MESPCSSPKHCWELAASEEAVKSLVLPLSAPRDTQMGRGLPGSPRPLPLGQHTSFYFAGCAAEIPNTVLFRGTEKVFLRPEAVAGRNQTPFHLC